MTLPDHLLELLRDHMFFRAGVAVGGVLLGALLLAAAKRIALTHLSRNAPLTRTRVDDVAAGALGRTTPVFLLAIPVLVAVAVLELPLPVQRVGRGLALLVCLFQVGRWGAYALGTFIDLRFAAAPGEPDDPMRTPAAKMLALAGKVVLWAVLALVALGNLGVDVTALVAGLGVGGVAIALAVQNLLGDLFAAVSILLDKPFVPGDFVIVDGLMGTVERIGIKTTRIRSLGGEQLVFSNADLLKSRLRNFKHMQERRVTFRIGVVYQTPADTLRALPTMLREAVEGQPGTRFDRAHFMSYGDFALMFEVVYYVVDPDYNRYMDIQQALNLEIHRRCADARIDFAYPTQTLFVQPRTLGMDDGDHQVR